MQMVLIIKKHFNLTQDCVYCTTGDPDVAPDGNLASGANVDDGSTTPRDRIWPRNHLTENKMSESILQLYEAARPGWLFIVTGASSSKDLQRLLALDVKCLNAVHDLFLVSD